MQFPVFNLIANLISTCYMTGLIWMVQVVHYPLFAKVGPDLYESYQLSHQSLITLIVGPPMLVEFVTAALLVRYRPATIPRWLTHLALALLVIIWASTAFIQVPCHEQLASGFDEAVHSWLVTSNWIRTAGWTARCALVTWMLAHVLNQPPA